MQEVVEYLRYENSIFMLIELMSLLVVSGILMLFWRKRSSMKGRFQKVF